MSVEDGLLSQAGDSRHRSEVEQKAELVQQRQELNVRGVPSDMTSGPFRNRRVAFHFL